MEVGPDVARYCIMLGAQSYTHTRTHAWSHRSEQTVSFKTKKIRRVYLLRHKISIDGDGFSGHNSVLCVNIIIYIISTMHKNQPHYT